MPNRIYTIAKSDIAEPPQPPPVARTPRLYWYQWAGVPLLALIVLLALLGVFGQSQSETSSRGPALTLRVEYPTKFRYKQISPMRVWVRNTTAATLDTVTISFSQAYINQFSSVTFTPSAQAAYEVALTAVAPGETRLVSVELQAERYGTHPGVVSATSGAADTTLARVSTFVFP